MSTPKNKLDAYARTLTDRITELEADRDEWKESTESANERFKIAERNVKALEAQLESIGAGGVGAMMPPVPSLKLTRENIDSAARFAIESDLLPPEEWESAGLYDFAHAVSGCVSVVDDLATLVRRIAHSLRKAAPGNNLVEHALDYLKRHGLDGSPLRQGEPVAQPAPAVALPAEPMAKLRVYMTTHDVGQSLAPNPPFKSARVGALKAADDLPLGDYDLYLATPTAPVAQPAPAVVGSEPSFYMSDDCAAGFASGDKGGAWVTTVRGGTKNTPLYLAQPHQIAEPATFHPMSTAPRDSTIVRLLVNFDDNALDDTTGPVQTIGHNNFDHDGEDRWQFAGWCWSHDCYTEGKGTPIGWLPFQMEPS